MPGSSGYFCKEISPVKVPKSLSIHLSFVTIFSIPFHDGPSLLSFNSHSGFETVLFGPYFLLPVFLTLPFFTAFISFK